MWPHARSKAAGARTAPVQSTSLGPSAVMITLPGWRSAWHSPSSGHRRSIRVRMPVAMCSGTMPPESRNGRQPVAQGEYVRRRRRLVNGYVEGREDRARLSKRHGAAARELQQGRSVEARQHDAEAPLQGHLVEHLRRRGAGGEDGAGHSRLVPAEPLRNAGLEQLHDLTGRPGVDVREGAFADLLPQGSPHRPSSRREEQTPGAGKREPLPSWPPV